MWKLLLCTLLSSFFVTYGILYFRNTFTFKFTSNGCGAKGKQKLIPKSNIQPKEWLLEELRGYNGIDRKENLIAVDWRVFDVSSSPKIYGPGGTYHYLAGRDATRSIVLLQQIKPDASVQEFDDYLDFTPEQRDSLNEWVEYFYSKYPEVGVLVKQYSPKDPEVDKNRRVGEYTYGEIQDHIIFSTGIHQQI